MDSFKPLISYEKREDDFKMIVLRVVSAVALIFFLYQLAQEPQNLDSLTSFADESMNDLFNWGNDRFVLGRQIADKSGNSTGKRKKSPQEIFMEAILDEEPAPATETKEEEEKPAAESEELDEPTIDRDALGDEDL
jgi:hypothetical protein